MLHRTRYLAALALLAGAACSKKDPAGAAGAPGGAAGGARPAPSITLAANDVAVVKRTSIEEGVAIAGDLGPEERVDVRARIEGDVMAAYEREGASVRAGQLLARFESTEQEGTQRSAEADRAAAQSELTTAQWNLDQGNDLYKAGAIAERDLRVSQQAVAAARARVAAADARIRANGLQVRDTRVLSPISGVIEKRMIEGGEHVSRGTALFTVVRNDILELAASVPAKLSTGLRVGQAVEFVADGRTVTGRVARISPTIDPASRSVTVYVRVPNPGSAIRGGTFVTGKVTNRVLDNVLVIPSAGLRQGTDNTKPFVYRIEGKTLGVVPVTLGVVDDRQGMAEVTSGLAEGDRVIVGNVGTLGRGMQVNIAGSAESARGGRQGKTVKP
ncbi:MAG: efflux transporter, family, subunit [Gemmatimonadetes bacterium]|nr:efflux transporter, family, subunit [Gemmatimonadota bacterium]